MDITTDVDTATSEVVASFGGAFDPLTDVIDTLQQFTIVYNNTTDGASGTGARMLQIDYIDTDFNAATAFHTLGSTGGDVTSFSGYGINRVVVVSLGGDLYNNNDITIASNGRCNYTSNGSSSKECYSTMYLSYTN